ESAPKDLKMGIGAVVGAVRGGGKQAGLEARRWLANGQVGGLPCGFLSNGFFVGKGAGYRENCDADEWGQDVGEFEAEGEGAAVSIHGGPCTGDLTSQAVDGPCIDVALDLLVAEGTR